MAASDGVFDEPSDTDFRDQVARLAQEKRDLKEYAERVTRELRRYQQARPPPERRAEDDFPLPPWATNMQMMTPLLFAYEERISELEAVVERSVSLADQAQVLTKENDALRVELHERTEQLRNLQLMAPARELAAARGGDAGGDPPEEVQELYRLSVEQNEALAQQNQLLKLQLEKMQQTLAATQRQAQEIQAKAVEGARVMSAEQERATKALIAEKETAQKAYAEEHERSETYARQRTAAENRLGVITGELTEQVRVREQLEGQVDRLQQELQVHRQNADFYKKSLEDQSALSADEAQRLQAELARTTRNERELRQRLGRLEQELSETWEQLLGARRENEETQREAEQMSRLIDSMDRRIHDISDKHQRVQAELTDKEGQIDELQSQKDSWETAARALKRQVERLQSQLQSETDSLQQRCVREADTLVSSHRRQLAEAQEQLGRSEQRQRELQSRVDVAERQARWESATLEQRTAALGEERSRLRIDLEEAQEDRLRADRAADLARQETTRLRGDLEVAERGASDAAAQARASHAAAQNQIQGLERSVGQLREEEQLCAARSRNSGLDLVRVQAELVQARAGEAAEAARERLQAEYRTAQRELQAQRDRTRRNEERAVELLRAQEVMRQRLQDEFAYDREVLEAQVARLTRENRSLRERTRRVVSAISAPGVQGLSFAPTPAVGGRE